MNPESMERIRKLEDALNATYNLVQRQAEDEGLWCITDRVAEAYLQQELRKLHHSVESNWREALGEDGEK